MRPHQFVYFLHNDSAKGHNFGCGTRVGPMTPKFELRRDFCTVHLATKFRHPIGSYRVDKQPEAAENIQLASLRHAGGE